MNKEAIEKIEQLVETRNIPTDKRAMLVPSGMELKDLSHLGEQKAWFSGSFNTDNLDAWADYVSANKNDDTQVFISPDGNASTAIINLGNVDNPQRGDHKATLGPCRTGTYVDLLDANNTRLSQLDLVNFLEDWRDIIEFHATNGDDIHLSTALSAVRRLKTKAETVVDSEVGNMNHKLSAMEKIEVNAKSLPAYFVFTCKPYEFMEAREFNCQIRTHSGEKPKISYRIIQLQTEKKEITEEMLKVIQSKTKDCKVYIGEFNL